MDHVVVVCHDICCCYACGDCGDLLVLRKCMVVCVCGLADSRVFGGLCDFVLCDYIDHVVVVCVDICCGYACGDCGDLLVLGNLMVVCVCILAEFM